MIAATVQGDVDGIPQGSHYASVPMIKPIGRLVGSATATLEDRLTAAVSTPNPSADGLQRDLLWVSGLSLVAVAPDLCVAAGESDRPAIEESQKVLIGGNLAVYASLYNTPPDNPRPYNTRESSRGISARGAGPRSLVAAWTTMAR